MARTVRDAGLDSRTARARLKVRREPHWKAISQGAHIGYRRGKKGGTWIARYYKVDGTYAYQALGVADDAQDADGAKVFNFAQAQERAREWFKEQTRQDEGLEIREGYTVVDAIKDYLAEYRTRGRSLAEIEYRVNAFILPEPHTDGSFFQGVLTIDSRSQLNVVVQTSAAGPVGGISVENRAVAGRRVSHPRERRHDVEREEICHVPPGNPDARHTILIGESAVGAHMAHGDYRGECDDDDDDEDDD